MNILAKTVPLLVIVAALGVADDGPPDDAPSDNPPNSEAESPSTAAEGVLPKLEVMKLPTVEELVKGPRVDWIVLDNEDVLVVQPVRPRPRTLEELDERLKAISLRTAREPEDRQRLAAEREELRNLVVQLPGDDVTEYRLPVRHIAQIVHHEDLLLARVRRLLGDGEVRAAYELFFPLARSSPGWPEVDEVQNELLLAQARVRLDEKRFEEALVYIEALHERKPGAAEISDQLAATFDALVGAAVEAEDFRRGRFFLHRLNRRLPDHDVGRAWAARLDARAKSIADVARLAEQAGEHGRAVDLASEAALAWPRSRGLRALQERTWNRWQRLRVGVREFGDVERRLPAVTNARRRHRELVESRLFAVRGVEHHALYGHADIRTWEPVDLGRGMTISLRRGRERWEALPPVTAGRVSRSIRERLDPTSSAHDERLASVVDSVAATSPYELELRFRRAPLRPEALLTIPIRGESGDVRGRFRLVRPGPDGSPERAGEQSTRLYRRTVPEPDGLRPEEYHIAEVVERRYGNWENALQGLLRDEVDVLPRVRPYDVAVLRADPRFEVRQYALPRTDVLLFNWGTPVLRSPSFRRAIAFATDAQRVAREVVFRTENSPHGRLVTAPWRHASTSYDRNVAVRRPDLGLAVALRLSAEKELKKLPELRMLVLGDDVAVAAAEEIVSDWRRVGIAARVVTEVEFLAESEPAWDVLYRSVSMAEPLLDVWPLLVASESARLEDLRVLPDWLRAELLELERVIDRREAETRMRRLHADLHADVRWLPLWEVDQYFVLATNVRPSTAGDVRSAHLYDDVECWVVRPSYPKEDW